MTPRRGTLVGSVASVLALVGCAPDLQDAADRADALARGNATRAEARLVALSTSSPVPQGEELLAAVREAVPNVRDAVAVFEAELVDEDTVALGVAFDGSVQGNETGIYYSSQSRVCVEMVVTAGDGAAVDVQDTPCDEKALASLGEYVPAQVPRTTSLED